MIEVEVLKQILLVVFMQGLSLFLEWLDTGTLSPTVKKRLALEGVVLGVYVSGLTVFSGMIDKELITLIGTAYSVLVVKKLYQFINSKGNNSKGNTSTDSSDTVSDDTE